MTDPGRLAVADCAFVLTGPTSGLGLAVLHELVQQGAPVLAVGRDIRRLAGSAASLVEADFADPKGTWLPAVETALNEMLAANPGKLIVLIANAGGIAPIAPATGIEATALQSALQINTVAPAMLAAATVRAAEAAGCRLRIVNVTTGAARRPLAGWLAYCTSKAASRMAFDVLALEHAAVELIHVDPGVIDTGMQAYVRAHDQSAAPVTALKSPELAAHDLLEAALELIA